MLGAGRNLLVVALKNNKNRSSINTVSSLVKQSSICYNTCNMVQVTRKDEREANENIIRRFNRKVLQSGVLAEAKAAMRFNKDISKVERRKKAIIRKERKADKLAKARLGLR
jgi:ribosomal protein S21